MEKLKTYLQQIDNSNYDFTNKIQIIEELKEMTDADPLATLNIIALSIEKSFTHLNNEAEASIYYPDVTKLTTKDFKYFEKRYKETSNLYLKVEYGLLIYLGAKTEYTKHLDFKKELLNNTLQLSKAYYEKKKDNFSYMHHSALLLESALGIANDSINNLKAGSKALSEYIESIILDSDLTNVDDIWITATYTTLLLEHHALLKQHINFAEILRINFLAAKEKEKEDFNDALFIADLCIRVAHKIGVDKTPYLTYKAQLLEKTAMSHIANNQGAAMHYIEQSLLAYKELKMEEDIKRLENSYEEIRGQIEMSEFSYTMPDEYTNQISHLIDQTIANSNEQEIIEHFIDTPWYKTIEEINDHTSNTADFPLSSIFPTDIKDKFGNTIARYVTAEEREEFRFWENYGVLFQLGSQTMFNFFTSAIYAKKLSYQSVLSYLETTWFNDPIMRKYAGQREEVEIKPIDILKPGLKRIFSEFELVSSDNEHPYDTITIIDSLTLKIESLLRYFCEHIGIPTFKSKQLRGKQIFMEKLLDDLLSDIAHQPKHKPTQNTGFDEEDRTMLRYVLVEKVGFNLRNKVAHGLMDESEYSFMLVVILFSLILKLSKYKFTENEGGINESNN